MSEKEPSDGAEVSAKPVNKFANDGSFLDVFKRLQNNQELDELTNKDEQAGSSHPMEGKSTNNKELKTVPQKHLPNKRRCTKLRVGKIEKKRKSDLNEGEKQDPWSSYLDEVRKYKERFCNTDDIKIHPLVK